MKRNIIHFINGSNKCPSDLNLLMILGKSGSFGAKQVNETGVMKIPSMKVVDADVSMASQSHIKSVTCELVQKDKNYPDCLKEIVAKASPLV